MLYKVIISTYWETFSLIQRADNKSAAKYRAFKYFKKIGWVHANTPFIDFLKLYVEGCVVYE